MLTENIVGIPIRAPFEKWVIQYVDRCEYFGSRAKVPFFGLKLDLMMRMIGPAIRIAQKCVKLRKTYH